MNTTSKRFLIAATIVAATSTGVVAAAASTPRSAATHVHTTSGTTSGSWTPNDCVRANGGDYAACNVGNSGRGDLPYLVVRAR
jgi:roadblock/LC7 domain-containing protein